MLESKANGQNRRGKGRTMLNEVFDWLDAGVVSIICVVLIFTFGFRMVGIVGDSMENTLFSGDRVIISSVNYTPTAGDIVVISRNYTNAEYVTDMQHEPIIKRIIATEGQKVDIDFNRGVVYVDGHPLSEPYAKTFTTSKKDVEFPLVVEPGHVFVLGDNRAVSLDSRSSDIGQVDVRYILGKAIYKVFPVDEFGEIE